MSQTWHVRPSNLLGVNYQDPIAFFIDSAVNHFGSSVEADLAAIGDKPDAEEKRVRRLRSARLERWLSDPEDGATGGAGYRDPAPRQQQEGQAPPQRGPKKYKDPAAPKG